MALTKLTQKTNVKDKYIYTFFIIIIIVMIFKDAEITHGCLKDKVKDKWKTSGLLYRSTRGLS